MSQVLDFEQLRSAEKDKVTTDNRSYDELLFRLADRETVDHAEVLTILERSGHSVDDLQNDVQWRSDRDRKILEVRKETEYNNDIAAVEKEFLRLNEEEKRFEAEIEEKRRPLRSRQHKAEEGLRRNSGFRKELLEGCRDVELLAEMEDLDSRQTALNTRYLEEQKERFRLEMVYAQQKIDQLPRFCPGRQEKIDYYTAEVESFRKRFDEFQAQIDEVEEKRDELEQAKKELQNRMILS